MLALNLSDFILLLLKNNQVSETLVYLTVLCLDLVLDLTQALDLH